VLESLDYLYLPAPDIDASIKATQRTLKEHGWSIEGVRFEIPQGPCIVFRDPGGQRLAAYQLVRPFMNTHFEGRFDT